MNEKKQRMIEVGMKLFAKKGFYATSIQEIAEQSGVSKGAFYLHFESKQDFTIAIYRYYHDTMRSRLRELSLLEFPSPQEKFAREIRVFFEEFLKHKEFIIMHFQENFSLHQEIEDLVLKMRVEQHAWYEETLLSIYGEKVQPFIIDGITIIEGFIDSYMKAMLFERIDVDLEKFSRFLVRRADDVITGMLEKEPEPLLTKEMLKPFYQKSTKKAEKEEVEALLHDMKNRLPHLQINKSKLHDLSETIEILLTEIKKAEPQKVIFQGMLSNFQGIASLDESRNKIEAILKIN